MKSGEVKLSLNVTAGSKSTANVAAESDAVQPDANTQTINQVPYGAIVGSANVAGLGGQSVIEHSPCHPRENTRVPVQAAIPQHFHPVPSINMAKVTSPLPYNANEAIVLSLQDGMGGLALSLKDEWADLGYTRYIAVEKNRDAHAVCDAANPATASFPGVEHGFNGHHDIFKLKEKDFADLPRNSLKLIGGAPMCNDFTKLRLLPDRPDYRGPPRDPNQDPRPGLNGKYGKTFRQTITIIGWALKYHPDCKYFVENVDFTDMAKDWAEVCDALGTPIIITSHDYSYTKRRRAYWCNFTIPDTFGEGHSPKDPNECLDPGRKVQKYHAHGRMCTRPLGGSWKGDPERPIAATNKPLLIVDEMTDELQHVRPEEAEQLHGMKRGTTQGPGITAMMRLKCIGAGWDINITRMLLHYLRPQTLEEHTRVYLVQLKNDYTPEQASQGKELYHFSCDSPEQFYTFIREMTSIHGVEYAAKMIALSENYRRLINVANANAGSILDSGAARHVSNKVKITDPDVKCKLTSFTGKESWTEGNGYIPTTLHDDLSGTDFPLDIEDADYSSESVSSLLSLCKLLRSHWKFELSLGNLYAFTPTGHRVTLLMGDDDVLRLPHGTREGGAAEKLPEINPCNAVQLTAQAATSNFLHRLFNHGNADKIHRTLGVTKGFKQPDKPIESPYCASCATANARKKGLSHKQYTILSVAASTSSSDDTTYEEYDTETEES